MSDDLAYLDTLSNKDLLKKCKEHGLPEVPVTESTRNVIIRRLRSAITGIPLNKGKSAGKKSAPRRETVHGSQVSAPTAGPVRRAAGRSPGRDAIGNTTTTTNSRRTIAAYAPDNTSLSGRSVQTTTTVSDVGSQSEDDDYFMVDSPRVAYSHATQTPPKEDRSRNRSVSLTKSGVLTTSYTREVDQPHYEHEQQQEDDIPNSYTYQRPHVPAVPRHTLPTYEPRIEPSKRSDFGFSRPLLTQTQLNSTSYQESEYNPSSRSPILSRNTFSGSAQPFGQAAPAPVLPRQRQSGYVRGSLLQPTTTLNSLYPQLNQFYDQPDNAAQPMEVDSESEEEEGDISPVRSSQLSRPRFSPQVRKPLVRAQDQVQSPMAQFRQLLVSLDQRYHIKLYFYVVLVAMLATFIYVIVTPNA